MNILNSIIHLRKIKLVFLILFSCKFYFANAFTLKDDSLKNILDGNDSRNAPCKCIEHQKLADEEYKKYLSKKIEVTSKNDYLDSKNKIISKKLWTRNRSYNFFNIIRKNNQRKWKVKKLNGKIAKCFRF